MEIETTPIEGLLLLRPSCFEDERGKFFESWNSRVFNEAVGSKITFVQDNESTSSAGVVRGLHFQKPPAAQGKLVRVSRGSILDIAVDIRPDSPTFGMHYAARLDAASRWQFWIPEGFAHGFIALEDDTTVLYKCTSPYTPACEGSLKWDDKDLGIEWGDSIFPHGAVISAKDANAQLFADFSSPF